MRSVSRIFFASCLGAALLSWAQVASARDVGTMIYTRPVTSVLFESSEATGLKFHSAHIRRSLYECVIESHEVLVSEQPQDADSLSFPIYKAKKSDQTELGNTLAMFVQNNRKTLKDFIYTRGDSGQLVSFDLMGAQRATNLPKEMAAQVVALAQNLESLCH